MSDTPRADVIRKRFAGKKVSSTECAALYDFASEIERELAEVTKQRDLLLEGLEKLASCDWVITLPDRMDAVREIARQTIEIVKNNEH